MTRYIIGVGFIITARILYGDPKSTAYKTYKKALVRPHLILEYASTVWSPNIGKLESVQRRAARWVMQDY